MDFRTSIIGARTHAWAAISELDRYDRSSAPNAPHNRSVVDAAVRQISPGATGEASRALEAARWERWVSVRQIRDTGTALALLDRAWWGLRDRSGTPDIDGARRALYEAVSMLDRANQGGHWAQPPVSPWWAARAA